MLKGVLTALVTPFDAKGRIDWEQLEQIVEFQIGAGVSGLVPVGTTGESPTLSAAETGDLIAKVVHWVNGRVPVVAGAGSNCTKTAIEKAIEATKLGADATMQVVPYYNKPTQEGIVKHFCAIADTVESPVVLYNVPSRVGVGLSVDAALRLASHERITALKDAGGDLMSSAKILANSPAGFSILSGEDGMTLPLLSLSADGVISVASNLFPELVVKMVELFNEGDQIAALDINVRLLPLYEVLFAEPNPTPVKFAMKVRFGMSDSTRLPLLTASPGLQQKIRDVVTSLDQYVREIGLTPQGTVET
jgi:4-hydroxy-tetrahydrodipicolinate synthase